MARRRPPAAFAALDSPDPRARMDAAYDLLRGALAGAPDEAVDAAAALVVPGLVALAERYRPAWAGYAPERADPEGGE
jgi:hypothetical protein